MIFSLKRYELLPGTQISLIYNIVNSIILFCDGIPKFFLVKKIKRISPRVSLNHKCLSSLYNSFFQFLLLTFSLCILCNFRQVTATSGFQRIGNNLIVLMITVPQYIGLSVFLSFCLLGQYTSYFATFKWSFLNHK